MAEFRIQLQAVWSQDGKFDGKGTSGIQDIEKPNMDKIKDIIHDSSTVIAYATQ